MYPRKNPAFLKPTEKAKKGIRQIYTLRGGKIGKKGLKKTKT